MVAEVVAGHVSTILRHVLGEDGVRVGTLRVGISAVIEDMFVGMASNAVFLGVEIGGSVAMISVAVVAVAARRGGSAFRSPKVARYAGLSG